VAGPPAARHLTPLAIGALLGGLVAGGAVGVGLRRVNRVRWHRPEALRQIRAGRSNVLFDTFPALADRIPWRPLGTFPTPVEELPSIPEAPAVRLFVKRDDLSSPHYGGNKVRKLEHFLADAQLSSARTLITLGGLGSNHALATAVHGKQLGFSVDLALYDQPVTPWVRTNVQGFLAAGARIHDSVSIPWAFVHCANLFRKRAAAGSAPYFIMVGGTSRLGCIGHVTAALELADQIAGGTLPLPDVVFVPLGTCGTAAGLIAGLKIAGLPTRVAAVRVADPVSANRVVLRHMAQDVADFLNRADPAVPRVRIEPTDFDLITHHFGEGYGLPTAAGEHAIRWADPRLVLDPTYSGKALAASLEHCGRPAAVGTVLFWNTFNSAAVEQAISLRDLPPRLRSLVDA
jgi:D-cysteine desulfhydrase